MTDVLLFVLIVAIWLAGWLALSWGLWRAWWHHIEHCAPPISFWRALGPRAR